MKTTNILKLIAGLAIGLTMAGATRAADVIKADSADNLDQGTAWVGGVPPTAADVAVWDSTIVTPNIPFLGQDTNYLGLRIANPAVPIEIGAGNALTLGGSGVDLSAATQNFTNGADVVLGAAQTWNIASGRAMAQNGALGGAGALLTKTGAGSLILASGTPATADGGLTVEAGTVATRSPQALGQLCLPGGVLTLQGNSTLDLNGFTSTSSTGWGTVSNVVVVPTGETATINFPGRAVMSSSLQVTGTLNLVVSYVRSEFSGNWSASPGQVRILAEPDGFADFRIINFVTPNFQRLHLGSGVFFYQAWNPPNNAVGNNMPIGELNGDVGASLASQPISGRWVNYLIGGLNTDARFNGNIVPQAGGRGSRIWKVGTGSWTIGGVNTYIGATEVREGKLVGVTGGSSLLTPLISVSNNATLGVLVETAPSWSGNNINFAGAATTLEINYGGAQPSTTTAPLIAAGTLTLNGAVAVNVKGGAWTSVGQYPLVKYTTIAGAGFPVMALGSVPNLVQGYLSNNTTTLTIDLVVTNTLQPLSWAAGNGTWDTATANWVDAGLSSATYQEVGGFGDSVLFEGTQSVGDPITVTLNSTVTPATVEASAKSYTISGLGSISGTASVTKSGTGTLALSTANSYTGGTRVNGGTLSFSALNNLGAASSPINLGGGTLLYAAANTANIAAGRTVTLSANSTIDVGANNVTYTSAIGGAGAGGLTKAGSGTLTLTGANNYTGNTTVSAGILGLAAAATISSSPIITVAGGAILDVSASGLVLSSGQTLTGDGAVNGSVTSGVGTSLKPGTSPGTLTVSNLTFSGGTYTYDVSTNSGRDLIVVNGDVSLNSGNIAVVTSEALTNGSYPLIQYSGTLLSGVGSSGNLVVNHSVAGKILRLVEGVGEISLLVETAGGTSIVWAGIGADWDVDASFNWNAGAAKYLNGDYVTFNDTGASQPNVNLAAGHFPGGVTVAGATAYTLSSTAGGRVSGAAGITNNGSATLTILTANNNTGPTVVTAGTIQVGDGVTTGALGTGNVINDGAVVFNQTDNRTLAGIVSGTGSLTQNGLTTLTLANNNSYSGPTGIGAGATLQVGTGGGTGTLGTGNTTDDGVLVFNRTGAFAYSGNISGAGAVSQNGAGTLTLSGANSYAGGTTNSAGALVVGSATAIPNTTALVVSGGTVNLNSNNVAVASLSGAGGTINNNVAGNTNTLTVGSDGFSTGFGGVIANGAGVLALNKVGIGSLVLSGVNTYSGGTVVSEGQLNLNNDAAAGSGGILLSNATVLFLDNVGAASVFPGNNVTVAADATATLNSDSLGSVAGGNFSSQNANSILNIDGQLSFGSATVQQFSNFTGKVVIGLAGIARFASTGLNNNGSDNTAWQIDGTVQSRNGTFAGPGIALGELTGTGILGANNSTGGNNTTFRIGGKGTSSTFSGTVSAGGATDPININKVGAGTLTLDGSVNHLGTTTVSQGVLALGGIAELDDSSVITVNAGASLDVTGIAGTLNIGNGVAVQTLAGGGTITGNVVATGTSIATVSPGPGVSNLTVSGSVTLAANSVVFMELNRPASDKLTAASVTPNGASLIVTNIGSTLRTGDTFQLFSTAASGFGSVVLPTTDASGLITYSFQDNLAVNGSITVLSGMNTNSPTLTNVVNGNTLELSWPADRTGWALQVQTNTLAVGISNNWFVVAGSTTTNQVIVPVNPANPTVFYRLTLP